MTGQQPAGRWRDQDTGELVPDPEQIASEQEITESEPIEYALPADVQSAYVALPEDPRLAEQRERTAAILDRGVLVLAVVGLITLGLALIATVSGNPSLFGWLLPFGFFGLAAGCYYLLQRMERKPPNSLEVPVSLADELTDAIAAREELEARGAEVLADEEYDSTLAEADELLEEASEAAAETLQAERAHDTKTAALKHTTAQNRVEAVLDLRDEILEEWDNEFTDEFDEEEDYDEHDDREYYVDRPPVDGTPASTGALYGQPPAQPAPSRASAATRQPQGRSVVKPVDAVSDQVEDIPSVIRPEVPDGIDDTVDAADGAAASERRSAQRSRSTRSSERSRGRGKRKAPYRPNSGDK